METCLCVSEMQAASACCKGKLLATMGRPLAAPEKQMSCATLQQGTSFLKEDLDAVLHDEGSSMAAKLEVSYLHIYSRIRVT